ncbi:MAG: methyltransferase, partial [Candidatus Acidiferrales bacterium]
GEYWVKQVRGTVEFARGMKTLGEMGIKHYVEVGPQAVLSGMGAECEGMAEAEWYASMRRQKGSEWKTLLESVRGLYMAGAEIDWEGFDRGHSRQRVLLPTYPFQRQRFWMDDSADGAGGANRDESSAWPNAVFAARRQSHQAPLDIGVTNFEAKWHCLERLTLAHVLSVLKQLGGFAALAREYSVDDVLRELHIQPAHRNLIARWLERLSHAGILRQVGNRFVCDAPLPDANLAARWKDAEHILHDDTSVLDYTRQCGSVLTAVLTGKLSALETLFPGGSFDVADNLYARSASSRYINAIAASAIESIVHTRRLQVPLRILEVGAGTGGTTTALLPLLPKEAVEYYFTDVSDLFLAHAADRFVKYPFVRYDRLDIDAPLEGQGYERAGFDIIVGANIFHAAKDLGAALERARALLSPGGILVLVETTQDQAWFDITTGLIEGWQHFNDEWRRGQPLLNVEKWKEALARYGFEDAQSFPEAGSVTGAVGQHVLLARAPGKSSTREVAQPVRRRDSATAHTAAPSGGASQSSANEDAVRRVAAMRRSLPSERHELLVEFVREEVMRTLRIDASRPPDRRSRLMDLGLDSLMAVQLRNRLSKGLALGEPLPATLMFDYPTIEAIARYVSESILADADGGGARSAQSPLPEDEPAAPLRAEDVQRMSDKEAEELLLKRLNEN